MLLISLRSTDRVITVFFSNHKCLVSALRAFSFFSGGVGVLRLHCRANVTQNKKIIKQRKKEDKKKDSLLLQMRLHVVSLIYLGVNRRESTLSAEEGVEAISTSLTQPPNQDVRRL